MYREDTIKNKFRENLEKVSKKEINKYTNKILDSLKIAYGVMYNEELLSDISNINISDPFKYADSLFIIGAKKELITYKNQKVTLVFELTTLSGAKNPFFFRYIRIKGES